MGSACWWMKARSMRFSGGYVGVEGGLVGWSFGLGEVVRGWWGGIARVGDGEEEGEGGRGEIVGGRNRGGGDWGGGEDGEEGTESLKDGKKGRKGGKSKDLTKSPSHR